MSDFRDQLVALIEEKRAERERLHVLIDTLRCVNSQIELLNVALYDLDHGLWGPDHE